MPRRVSNSIRTQLKRWTATTSNLTKQSLGKSARSQLFRALCPTKPHLRNLPSRRSNRQSRDADSHTPAARQGQPVFFVVWSLKKLSFRDSGQIAFLDI